MMMIQHSRKHMLETMMTAPSCKPRPAKRARMTKKAVRFATTCQVRTIIHEPSNDDAQPTWYGKQEYRAFRKTCKEDIYAFAMSQKVGSFDSNEHCVRGLENLFPPTKRVLDQRKRERVHVVLGQQNMQRAAGAYEPETIAILSGMMSENSCARAAAFGRRDTMVWVEP